MYSEKAISIYLGEDERIIFIAILYCDEINIIRKLIFKPFYK